MTVILMIIDINPVCVTRHVEQRERLYLTFRDTLRNFLNENSMRGACIAQ